MRVVTSAGELCVAALPAACDLAKTDIQAIGFGTETVPCR
jgi:hypothetical protein